LVARAAPCRTITGENISPFHQQSGLAESVLPALSESSENKKQLGSLAFARHQPRNRQLSPFGTNMDLDIAWIPRILTISTPSNQE
jgi:hypothetical protein